MEDRIDPSGGFVIRADPALTVVEGDVLGIVHAAAESDLAVGMKVIEEAITIGDEPGTCLDLVATRITADGSEKWKRPKR